MTPSKHDTVATGHLRIHQFAALKPGPRLIVTAAVHGNEVCGVKAIHRIADMLDSGALQLLCGTLTLLPVTNPLAYQRAEREGERNLNRRLQPPVIAQDYEDRIARQLCPLLAAHEVLLDLHSFNNPGVPFVMLGPRDNRGDLEPFSHEAAESALALAVGTGRIVEGWLSTYALALQRRAARSPCDDRQPAVALDAQYGVGTTEYMRSQGGWGITLECGQHQDPQAPEVAFLAILRTLALLDMISSDAVEPANEARPIELLQLYEVVDRDHADDRFEREWASFDAVQRGQRLGTRADGSAVLAPDDGLIVFPNSRALPGYEWFYLARKSDRCLGPADRIE